MSHELAAATHDLHEFLMARLRSQGDANKLTEGQAERLRRLLERDRLETMYLTQLERR